MGEGWGEVGNIFAFLRFFGFVYLLHFAESDVGASRSLRSGVERKVQFGFAFLRNLFAWESSHGMHVDRANAIAEAMGRPYRGLWPQVNVVYKP